MDIRHPIVMVASRCTIPNDLYLYRLVGGDSWQSMPKSYLHAIDKKVYEVGTLVFAVTFLREAPIGGLAVDRGASWFGIQPIPETCMVVEATDECITFWYQGKHIKTYQGDGFELVLDKESDRSDGAHFQEVDGEFISRPRGLIQPCDFRFYIISRINAIKTIKETLSGRNKWNAQEGACDGS